VIFAAQNLIQDPPFTRVDLISCRNLLIYLNAELQKEIFPQFHYALNPGGILFLGTSESIGLFDDLFSAIDKKWKIYQRKDTRASFPVSKLSLLPVSPGESSRAPLKSLSTEFQTGNIARQIERLLLDRLRRSASSSMNTVKLFIFTAAQGNILNPLRVSRAGILLRWPGKACVCRWCHRCV
jgi:two-component system CheB/CheR fusion protein